MDILPDEVWYDILNRVDYFDLVRLKTVSKRWHEIVKRVILRTYMYYEKCLKEIPRKYWISILERQTHPEINFDDLHATKIHSQIWYSMYQSWIGWNSLLDKSPKQRSIDVTISHISSLDVTGNIIAIGSIFGEGYFYDMRQLGNAPLYATQCALNGVWLWRKGNDIRAVSYSETMEGMTLIKRWDVVSKRQIDAIEYMRPTLTSTSLDYCYTLIPYMTDEEDDCTDYESRIAHTLKIERLGSDQEARIIQFPKVGSIDFMEADGDRVLMSSIDYQTDVINIYASSLKYDFKKISSFPCELIDDNAIVEIMKSGVLSTIGMDGSKIGFSVDGRDWKFYDVQRDLDSSSKVTQILYHVGLLILGFESGEVRIIHVDDRLENLNFDTMRSMSLKFSSDSVAHLNVTEYDSKQYLIVASMLKLYFVEFMNKDEISRV